MPRRPRPAHRQQPKNAPTKEGRPKLPSKNSPALGSKRRFPEPEPSDSEEESDSGLDVGDEGEFEEGSSQGSGSNEEFEEDGDEDDVDVDAPRVAQWEEDDEGFLEESEEEKDGPEEDTLKSNLQDLPLGALRQAQRILSQAEAETDSGSDSDGDSGNGSDDEGPPVQDLKGKGKEKVEKVEWSNKRRDDIAKRSSKHAPMEVTSKRPVTRNRQVVEVPKIVPRDPRFLPMTGEFSVDKFQQSYGFLADNHKKELTALREALKQARKMLSSSPRDLRTERENEVYRLEQAVKRAESLVNKDRLDRVQREALGKVKKEEIAKRSQGKKEWHMKRGEKQKVVVQARYEELAKEGGQRAVKRAIEKKQKKESQKEKRSRPYAKGEYSAKDGDRPVKRRRV